MKRIIVIGSGIAGLVAALRLSRDHSVTLVTKARLEDSNTRFAQGGIAAAMFQDDSIAEHIQDTMRAGAGLCDAKAVEVLCSEGPARIRDLLQLGVEFDRHNGDLARGMEAAHSRARVLHAGGDSTGLSIETTLARAVRQTAALVLEHTFARDLILDRGNVVGVEILDENGNRQSLSADAVILASGGAGQLYLHTTNPEVATGDGIAMALRAGAILADLEFYQFHPTALALPGTFLISEAVRGEGAVLLDNHGRRFMQYLHPDAELAPRDVVARGIAHQMQAQDGQPVLLDATALGAEYLASRFPTIDAACRARGLDWAKNPVPVTPAAHYWMGGVRTDLWGRTSVPGLFAVGEVACTGVHGANRLASNSLLESLVFAWRCADAVSNPASQSQSPDFPNECVHTAPMDSPQRRTSSAFTRTDLRQLMWNAAGIERNAASLRSAAEELASWTSPESQTVPELETRNLLALARVIVAAALAREESRGAHFRTDFPETSERFHLSLAYAHTEAVTC